MTDSKENIEKGWWRSYQELEKQREMMNLIPLVLFSFYQACMIFKIVFLNTDEFY